MKDDGGYPKCQRKIPIYMRCTIHRMNQSGKCQSGHMDGPVPFLVACLLSSDTKRKRKKRKNP